MSDRFLTNAQRGGAGSSEDDEYDKAADALTEMLLYEREELTSWSMTPWLRGASEPHGRMASPSISTLAWGSIRAETWTSVIAGKCRPSVLPHAAPIAAPAALNSAMSVT